MQEKAAAIESKKSETLTAQEILAPVDTLVLDSTCSYRHVGKTDRWPRFATLRMDVRRKVEPDLVADARFMPFRDGIFDEIYCDPPHLFKKNNPESLRKMRIAHRFAGGRWRQSHGAFERYSFWNSQEEWEDFRKKTNDEFARTLKDKGVLYYKITDGKKGKGLTHFEDLKSYWRFVHVQTKEKSKSAFKNRVLYLTFMPARIELELGGSTPV